MEYCYSCMSQLKTEAAVCPFCKSSLPYIPVHPEDLPPGTRLNEGRFIVGRALGHGGYGITYIAYDTKMLVRRTIKEYYPRGAVRDANLVPVYPESEEANVDRTRKHFLHEARMMIRASEGHIPGIVQGIDTFAENGTSYILMEYLEGCTLDDHMQKVGPFPWKTAVHYAADVLDALQKLHEKNILHRDISCNNIFLCSDNTVRLIDFGSAEPVDQAGTDPGSLWRSRKPAYTPREQAENRPQGPWSDVYAMGVALFKMITGGVDRQLNGKTLPSVRAHVRDNTVPAALDGILKTATAEEPEKRFQSAKEFRSKLLPLIGEKDKGSKRTRLLALLAALLAALVLIVVLVSGNDTDTWSVVELDEEIVDDVTVRYGEAYTLSGTSQPGEGVRMILVRDNTDEQIVADETVADTDGHWELSYNTRMTEVDVNRSAGYVSYVGYQSEGHKNRSGEVHLTVDRTLTPLTIAYAGQNSTVMEVSLGDKITVTGTGQDGQLVKVRAGSAAEWFADWQDGVWTCEIDTSMLKPGANELTRELEIRAYYDGMQKQTLTEDSLNLTVRRTLAPIEIAFGDGTDSITVLDINDTVKVAGTAEPRETLTVMIGAANTERITVYADGTWEAELPKVNRITEYEFNKRIEIPVYAAYSADLNQTSEKITLVSNVGSDEHPVIQSSHIQAQEGNDITLNGTAEAGATLTAEIAKGETPMAVPRTLTTVSGDDGRWTMTLQTSDFVDDRPEGKWTAYNVTVSQQKGEKKLISNSVEVSIFKSKSFDIPTIAFAGIEGSEKTVRYTELVELTGTASAGEHLNVLVDGEALQADVLTEDDGTWKYTLTIPADRTPALNAATEIGLRVQYVVSDEKSGELTLTVTNMEFKALTLDINGNGTQAIGGADEKITLYLVGEPGEQVTLYRNGSVFQTVTLDETGRKGVTLTGNLMTAGADEATFQAQYTSQSENRSEEAVLRLDQNADPIQADGNLNEETTELRGTGEPGATIALKIGERDGGSVTVDADGNFGFTGLQMNAGERVVLTETDAYGNSATWNASVSQTERADITLSGRANGDYLTYGPAGKDLQLSGTAAAGKTVEVVCTDKASGEEERYTTAADAENRWDLTVPLPLEDQRQTDVTIRYEDGRGSKSELHAVCDNSVDPLAVLEDTIYEQTPAAVNCSVGEAGCVIRWVLKSADGSVKQEGDREVDGLKVEISLPTGRTAGDIFEMTVTDPCGNEAVTRMTVAQQRNQMSGKISSVLWDDKDVYEGDTIGGALTIQAFAVAGVEAAGTPSVQLVQGGNVLSRSNLTPATGDDLQRVASKFPDKQADLAWQIKGGYLAPEGIGEGGCELRLIMGDTTLESWALTYSSSASGVDTAMQYDDPGEGYDIGMDAPTGAFRQNGIYLTGWLYDLYDEMPLTMKSGTLNLYEDQSCTALTRSMTAKNITTRGRIPSTTNCGADAKDFSGDVSKSGWIMNFQDKNVSDGTYWAQLETAGLTFGPFQLTIDNNAAQIRQNEFIKSLPWGTEE